MKNPKSSLKPANIAIIMDIMNIITIMAMIIIMRITTILIIMSIPIPKPLQKPSI
ncbi:MAG: hypothetical protein WBM07_13035 [Chitinivibrionales bacterium]